MNNIGGKKFLLQLFHISMCFSKTAVIILMFLIIISLSISQVSAQNTVIVGPQIDIYIGPKDQWMSAGEGPASYVALDSINNRFLVVWEDDRNDQGQPYYWERDIYGQLINADGTLYGSPIAISTLSGSQQLSPRVVFDSTNGRFLIIWRDTRDIAPWDYGPWNTYGQLVNADGTLYGDNFAISTITGGEYHGMSPSGVVFDTVSERFFVTMVGHTEGGFYVPYNVFGQFVNADGSLYASPFPITNYMEGYGVGGHALAYDLNNRRFLVAWGLNEDKQIHARLLNADGTFYGSEFTISTTLGPYDRGNALSSISFDPVHSRFLVIWSTAYGDYTHGQVVNADGTLHGTEIAISDYPSGFGSAIFDTTNNKFLVVGYKGHPPIFGQLLNPDGSLYGSQFTILDVLYSSPLWPFVAFGSGGIGSLVVWADTPYYSESGYDIFGKFVKLEPPADTTPPVVTITAPADGGWYRTATLPALAYTVSDDLDPDPSVVVSGWSTAEGVHTAAVTATDDAGNVGSASITYSVDNTPPVITVTSPLPGIYNVPQTLTYTVIDNLDPAPTISGPANGTVYYAEGLYSISITATDKVGNIASASVTFTIRDTVAYMLDELKSAVNALDDSVFKNNAKQRKNALSNKIDEVISLYRAGQYQEALNKLQNDIRPKLDSTSTQSWVTTSLPGIISLIDEISETLSAHCGQRKEDIRNEKH